MGEIKPKKTVSRNVAVALGIVCILLIAIIAYFSVTGNSAQNSYNNLQNSYNNLQNQFNDLNTTYNNYTSTHSHTNADYDSMWAPELVLINLTTINDTVIYYPSFAVRISWLNVTGYVVNVHKNWAYNCTLHVVAYGDAYVGAAIDSYINLGTIAGESWANVGPNLYKVAGDITNYTITPQWTASP